MPELAPFARLARLPLQYQVIGRAEQLKVIDVIDHGNVLRFQFPQNRRRQMVIDAPNMRDIRPELLDHRANPPPRVRRINCMPHPPRLLPPCRLGLEVNVGHEVSIVRSRLATRISHREQRHFMALRPHQFHQFEQVNLGPAEGIVIFVAVQNSHGECFPVAGRPAEEIIRRRIPGSCCG